jgi:hypothetical protein
MGCSSMPRDHTGKDKTKASDLRGQGHVTRGQGRDQGLNHSCEVQHFPTYTLAITQGLTHRVLIICSLNVAILIKMVERLKDCGLKIMF